MAVLKSAPVRTLNHYQVLMLDPDVDEEVLEAVYRRLIRRAMDADLDERRRVHVVRTIKRAYSVLHDPASRRAYDLELAGGPDRQEAAPRAVPVPVSVAADARAAVQAQPAPAAVPVQPAPAIIPVAKPVPAPTTSGAVLDFGRYAGMSLRQVGLRDRNYLEWLRRTPAGRMYQGEIATILTPR
jgi:hypothetical protein